MPIGKITTGVITDSAVTEAKLGAGTSSGTAVTQWHVDNLTFNSNQLSTSGTQDLILFPDTAQVGINTSSPGATLDVNGTLQAGSMKIDNTTLSTVNTNENLVISPNGSGNVEVTSVLQVDTITSNDSSALSFNTPIHVNTISSVDSSVVVIDDGLKINGLATDNALLYNAGDGTVGESSILAIDEANERLGIGTSSPSVKLDIVGESTNESQVRIAQHNTGSDAPDIRMFKSRGTEATPTAVANSDNLAFVNSFAYDGSSYVQSGAFGWTADGTDGDSAFRINTRVANSTAIRFQINASGNGVFTGSVQGKGFTEDMNALTSSSTITVNCDLARVHTVTLGTNTEFNITNLPTGGTVTLIITQDGTGSRTATFGTDGSSAVRFPSGSSVLSTGANDIDVVSIFNDGTNFLGNIARNYS